MKTISIIFILIALLSCKNTKEIVKNETEVKTSTESVVVKTSDSKAVSNIISKKTATTTEDDYTYIIEEIEELSVPDSEGKQHPTKITKRVISTDKTKQGKTDIEESSIQDAVTKKTETENKISDQIVSIDTEVKTVKKSQSWKSLFVLFLILSAIGFIVYKINGGAIKSFISKIWKQ